MTLKDYIKSKYSAASVSGHYCNAQRYLAYTGDKAMTASYQDVLDYVAALRKQELHEKTLRNYLFAVKIYYNYLQSTGQRADHPCRNLHLKDPINRAIPLETLYTRKDLDELLQQYQALDKKLQSRNEVVVGLLVHQALTIREVAALQLENVDLENGQVSIKESVQLRARTLPLQPSQILKMHRYIHESRQAILQYTRKQTSALIVTKYGAGIAPSGVFSVLRDKVAPQRKYLPIKIRQSVIAHLLKEGHNLRVVQVFAGHRRSSATEAYKQTGFEELKDDVRKLHPLK